MNDRPIKSTFWRQLLISLVATAAITFVALQLALPGYWAQLATLRPTLKAPDFDVIAQSSAMIQIHLAGALVALAIGIVLLAGVKGTIMHRTLGWFWVIAMAVTAVSSLFIKELNQGNYSPIHLLSGWTIIILPIAVAMARTHRVKPHQRMMTGMFVGGLLVAGAFTFLPGRTLWNVFFANGAPV